MGKSKYRSHIRKSTLDRKFSLIRRPLYRRVTIKEEKALFGPRTCLDTLERRRVPYTCGELNHEPLAVRPAASTVYRLRPHGIRPHAIPILLMHATRPISITPVCIPTASDLCTQDTHTHTRTHNLR
jgi:hypothetical protein